MKEDNLGFFTGSMVAVSISAAMLFAFYNWAYGKGADSERCERKHGYSFENTKPAFAGIK